MGALYSQPVARDYRSAGFGGFLLRLVGIFIGWVLPFLITYFTHYFWMKEFTYWEQPETAFLNKAVVEVVGQEAGGRVSKLHWVSLPELEPLIDQASLAPLRFANYEEDVNSDGVADRMFFEIDVPLPASFRAYTFAAALMFQFTTGRRADDTILEIDMETMCEVSYASPIPLSRVTVDGDLKFQQREPLIHHRFTDYNEIYNRSLFEPSIITAPAQVQLPYVINSYASRNETTFLEQRGLSWEPDTASESDPRVLAVRVAMRNVKQPFTHRADPAMAIKFGMIQYFTFWYIFTSLAALIRQVLVTGGVVDTVAQCTEIDELRRGRVY